MKYILLDTNMYLDMIVSRNNTSKAGSYEEIMKLLDYDKLKIIIPKIVKEEVNRHLNSEINKIGKTIKLIRKNLDDLYWINHIDLLNSFNSKLSAIKQVLGGLDDEFEVNKSKYLVNSIEKINKLFDHANCIEIKEDNDLMNNVQVRKMYQKCPTHILGKDSSADALIIETLINIERFLNVKTGDKIFFISRNTSDFSQGNSKDLKEKLHNDIVEDLSKKGLGNTIEYRVFLTKTIFDDFKTEAEEIGILEELIDEIEREEEDYKEQMLLYRQNMDRESVGLLPLGDDSIYTERIFEMQSSIDFICKLEKLTSEYIKDIESYIEVYYDIINKIESSEKVYLKSKVDKFNNVNRVLPIKKFEKEGSDAIIRYIRENIADVKMFEESLVSIEFQDYMNFGNILLMNDVFGKPVRIEMTGELDPREDDTDSLYITLDINGNRIASGEIQIYYGYMNFDFDGVAADGAEESIDFYIRDITNKLEEQFNYYDGIISKAKSKMDIFQNTLNIE